MIITIYKVIPFSTEAAVSEDASKYLFGDLNEDGVVDISDLSAVIQYIGGISLSETQIVLADVNGDGVIDELDKNEINDNIVYGKKLSIYSNLLDYGLCGNKTKYYLKNDGLFIMFGEGNMTSYWRQSDRAPWNSFVDKIYTVNIKPGVTSIGDHAFYNCKNLVSVTIPEGIKSIGDWAFLGCSKLPSIIIPNSVQSIGASAFSCCDSFTKISIPENVTNIDYSAFHSDGLKYIDVNANNTKYASLDGNLYNKEKTILIQYVAGKTDSDFAVPESVSSIGPEAFYSCSNLSSVTIPISVTRIGLCAFLGCSNLTNINIPNSVVTIDDEAFRNCTNLVNVTISKRVKNIGEEVFSHCESLSSVVIPENILSIDESACYYFKKLSSVSIGNSVTSIGNSAFYGCTNLKDVYYSGTQDAWKGITIGNYNSVLTNATIHYQVPTSKFAVVVYDTKIGDIGEYYIEKGVCEYTFDNDSYIYIRN